MPYFNIIAAAPELRSKKQLIESFMADINDVDDVLAGWQGYALKKREQELCAIISEEGLKAFFDKHFGIGSDGGALGNAPFR